MIISEANLEKLREQLSLRFTAGLKEADEDISAIVEEVGSSAAIGTYAFMGDMPIFRKWLGEKRVKSLQEKAYRLENDDFEMTVGIKRKSIEDDQLGLYGPIVSGWGRNSGRLRAQLVFAALAAGHTRECYDGQNYFDTDHPVGDTIVSNMSGAGAVQPWYLIDASQPLRPILFQNRKAATFSMLTKPDSDHVFKTGEYLMGAEARGAAGYTYWQMAHRSTAAINKANYEAARDAMMAIKDEEGEPLGIKPTHFVTGNSNWAAARDLFEKANLAGGESNVLFGEVKVMLAKRLP